MFDESFMIEHFYSSPLSTAGSPITIALFGSFQINIAEQPESKFRTNKSRALLAYLLLARGQPVLRTHLIELLWPGYRKESALASLRQVLTDLRKNFAPRKLLEADYHSVRLRSDPALFTCDALRFDDLLAACEQHVHDTLAHCPICQQNRQQALALYKGPFLDNFPTVDSAPFQAWLTEQRQRYAVRAANSRAALQSSDKPSSAILSNLPTPLTPLLGRAGELSELVEKLHHPVYRCLTLVGPGGIGKTRLALALGGQQAATFPDGVWFVDLAALAPPTTPLPPALDEEATEAATTTRVQLHQRLATAMLTARGVTLQGATPPVTQLLTYMQDKALLLILDNFEHLDAGADLLAQLLRQASALRLLVTTRHRPALQGQLLYQVAGLAWPQPTALATLLPSQLVARYASLQLFLERATLTQQELTLEPTTLTAIAEICQAVEGSPLALELAAALLEMHTPIVVAQLVQTNYHALQSVYQDLPPRQRSAQAVLRTAWNLLTAEEAQTLACCAVFQGSFTGAAAQAVAGATPAILEALLHKSLLHQVAHDATATSDQGTAALLGAERYHIHRLVQQFAADQLRTQPAHLQASYDRHAAYYLALVGSWQPTAAAEAHFRNAMQADLENVESAWAWILAGEQLTQLTPAVEGLVEFYEMIGAFFAAEAGLQRTITAVRLQLARHNERGAHAAGVGTEPSPALARPLHTLLATLLTQLAYVYSVGLGQPQPARAASEEALTLAEALNDPKLRVRSYHGLMAIAYGESQFAQSRALGEKALQLARQANLRREEIMCMCGVGLAASALQAYATALDYLRPALALAEATSDVRKGMLVRSQLGITYRDMGDFGEALHCFEHNLYLTQQNKDAYTIAVNSANLGFLQMLLGSYSAAANNLEAGYQRFRAIGEKQLMHDCYAVLGFLHLQQGDYTGSAENCQRVLAQPEARIAAQQVAWLTLGDLHMAQGAWAAAQAAYTQLAMLSQQSDELGARLLGECSAASTLLARQDGAGALAALEGLLPHFDPTRFDTFFSAPRFLLTAYDILVANADPRATGILQQAGAIVREGAAKISDPHLRNSYLTKVATNHRICTLLAAPS